MPADKHKDIYKSFDYLGGPILAEFRKLYGLSREKLRDQYHILSTTNLGAYETGVKPLPPSTLNAFCTSLHIPFDFDEGIVHEAREQLAHIVHCFMQMESKACMERIRALHDHLDHYLYSYAFFYGVLFAYLYLVFVEGMHAKSDVLPAKEEQERDAKPLRNLLGSADAMQKLLERNLFCFSGDEAAFLLDSISFVYDQTHAYAQASAYQKRAIDMADGKSIAGVKEMVQYHLIRSYTNLYQYEDALSLISSLRQYYLEEKNFAKLLNLEGMYANVLCILGMPETSIRVNRKLEENNGQYLSDTERAWIHGNIGYAYLKMHAWDKALEYTQRALDEGTAEFDYAMHLLYLQYKKGNKDACRPVVRALRKRIRESGDKSLEKYRRYFVDLVAAALKTEGKSFENVLPRSIRQAKIHHDLETLKMVLEVAITYYTERKEYQKLAAYQEAYIDLLLKRRI